MITTAFVKIWGELVGAIAWDENQELGFFEYDKSFKAKQIELAPLKMPLNRRQTVFSFPELRPDRKSMANTFKGLPGLLADSLPDKYGNQLMNAWLAQQGRPMNSMNPVEQLCFMGRRGMGALEFEPYNNTSKPNITKIEVASMVEIASRMLQQRENLQVSISENQENAMKQLITVGTSAGGARPKAVIAFNEKTGEVRSGQAHVPKGFEHWLIKMDGVSDIQLGDTQGYGRVEMAYYLMAVDSGITMMSSQLFEENGRAHFMTKRFDRGEDNEKLHTQTFCAIQHFDFNEVNSFSYEQLFQTMRMLRLTYQEAEEMYRRMVFNVLAKNCDDHTKNFSFMLRQNSNWELAPAYDICHAYRPDSIWVSQHALSVNGKRKNILLSDLLNIGKNMNIKHAKSIVKHIDEVVSNWLNYARKIGVEEAKAMQVSKTLIKLN